MSETSTTALAAPTKTSPSRLIDDPRELSEEQLVELLNQGAGRAIAVGVVGGAAASAATLALSYITPIGAWAMLPAAVVGIIAAFVGARRQVAAQLGVSPACFARVHAAYSSVELRRKRTWRDGWESTVRPRQHLLRVVVPELRKKLAEESST